eukprot:GILJ01012170.1.p1 GENE.GILJ01012170.1~~GILJ01012170.1.p1  ORF type:complete len:539 (+),score=70.30 GILJ01012170.1:236-1618(+)
MPAAEESWIKATALVGTLCGQLIFGVLGDCFGRKSVYGLTLIIMIVSTLLSSLSSNTFLGIGIVPMICFFRFCLGVGIGGDYPLSAVITSEYASQNRRGQMMAAVFAMQGLGILFASLVSIIVVASFKSAIYEDTANLDYVWRIVVAIGIIPAALTMYLRSQLPETPRFTMHIQGRTDQAVSDVTQVMNSRTSSSETEPRNESVNRDVSSPLNNTVQTPVANQRITIESLRNYFRHYRNWSVLFGTASTWFLLDVAFYSQNLFLPHVMSSIGFVPSDASATPYDIVYLSAVGNAVISLLGTVPGYWFTVFFIERMGRLKIQYMGFAMISLLLLILASAYNQIANITWLFVGLYSLTFFFANFGPNSTTFIIPGEVYPTWVRSTAHGFSAACGKAGAIFGTFGFGHLSQSKGIPTTLWCLFGFTVAGFICTRFVPEPKGKSLEELTDEPSHIELPTVQSRT